MSAVVSPGGRRRTYFGGLADRRARRGAVFAPGVLLDPPEVHFGRAGGATLAEMFPTPVRNTAMGVLAVTVGVSHGLLLAFAFALLTAAWVWTFPETKGVALTA